MLAQQKESDRFTDGLAPSIKASISSSDYYKLKISNLQD
jgi:hypothetical protein